MTYICSECWVNEFSLKWSFFAILFNSRSWFGSLKVDFCLPLMLYKKTVTTVQIPTCHMNPQCIATEAISNYS